MLGIKESLIKILNTVHVLPNYFNPDGGDTTTRPTSADIASNNKGNVFTFLSTSAMETGKPPLGDGNILQFNWDNSDTWASQLFIGHSAGSGIQHRVQQSDANKTWSPWYDVYHMPKEIPANQNLNDYTTRGRYYCPLTNTARTLTNCPIQTAFTMDVEDYTHPNQTNTSDYWYRMQTLYTSNRSDQIFRRYLNSLDGGETWNISEYGWVQLGYIPDRQSITKTDSYSIPANTTHNIVSISLPAHTGKWLVLSRVGTTSGANQTISNEIGVSGTGSSLFSAIVRCTTSSGQGVANWGLVTVGSAACTVVVKGHNYSSAAVTNSASIAAIRL